MKNVGFYDLYSTYQKDYISHKIEIAPKPSTILYDPLEKIKPKEKPIKINLESLTPFKQNVEIPFNLYFRLKECIQTNPYEKIVCINGEKRNDFEEKLKIRKTRPRVYMTPQICLDDIPEDAMYNENGIAENIYTTEWRRESKAIWSNNMENQKNLNICKNEKLESTLDIEKLMKNIRNRNVHSHPRLDLHTEKDLKEWYSSQPNIFVDTTKLFWEKNKDKKICELKTKNHFETSEKDVIEKYVEEGSLRQAFSRKLTGYGGYIPKLPVGMKPEKKLFKIYEPWLTTNMMAQNEFIL